MNRVSANVDEMEIHIIQSKNSIMINISVKVKYQLIGFPVKKAIYGILEVIVQVIVSVIKCIELVSI